MFWCILLISSNAGWGNLSYREKFKVLKIHTLFLKFQVDFDKVEKVESGWDESGAKSNESDDFW